jgi:hypothetical protein
VAFKAGAIVGEAILDDSKWQSGSKRLDQSNQSMTKSFITAQLAVDVFKKVLSKSTEVMKKSVQDAISLQENNNRLKVTFSGIQKEANKTRDTLVKSFGFSRIAATKFLATTGDILTGLGFSQKKALSFSKQVQELSADLSSFANVPIKQASDAITKAMLGETEAAKSLGIVIRQDTKEFREAVEVIQEQTGVTLAEARAQVILEEAISQSKNAIGDFARTSESLANQQRQLVAETEDLSVALGEKLLPIQGQIISFRRTMVKQLTSLIDGTANITKHVEKQRDTVNGLLVELSEQNTKEERRKEIIDELNTNYPELIRNIKLEEINTNNLADAISSVNEQATRKIVQAQAEEASIMLIEHRVGAITKKLQAEAEARKILAKLQTFGISRDEIENTTLSEKVNVLNSLANENELVARKRFDNLKLLKKLQKQEDLRSQMINEISKADKGLIEIETEVQKILGESARITAENTEVMEESNERRFSPKPSREWLTQQKSVMDEWKKLQKQTIQENIKDIEERRDKFIEFGTDEVEATEWANKEIRDAWSKRAIEILNTIKFVMEQATSLYSDIFDTIMTFQENDLEQLKATNAKKEEEIEEANERRLEKEDERHIAEQEALQQNLDNNLITQAEFDAQSEELEAQHLENENIIRQENEKRLEEEKKKNRAKENAKEKEIFEAKKANQISLIWIQAALGIVSAWTQSIAQLGPIAGSIFAGVLTAAILGVSIAQTVAVSQQTFIPAKAEGGMAGGRTRVNELGGEIITLPDGSQVIPNDISQQIAGNVGGGNIINISFKGAVISDDMSLRRITDHVLTELGNQLNLAIG